MKTATDTPLMDQVHAWLFAEHLFGRRVTSEGRKVSARTRALLRQAEKFSIDDDAVRLVCHLSHQEDRLESWSFLARLPYPVCWFELDLHVKCREFAQMNKLTNKFNPNEVSQRVGYLIYYDDPPSPRWVVQQFYKQPENREPVIPGLINFIFDPEGDSYNPVKGSKFWHSPSLSQRLDFDSVLARTRDSTDDLPVPAEALVMGRTMKVNENQLGADDRFANRVGVIPDPFWQTSMGDSQKFLDAVHMELVEEAGHLRYLMTLLAAINGLPRDVRPAHTLTGRRTVGAHILPYFQHHTISIKIPREDRVVWARKRMDAAARNAPRSWHQVRGHWRIVERGRTPGRRPGSEWCRHVPTMVESGLGLCERCGLLIRWIPNHHRGDPNLGIVSHDHQVRT